ncbi:MAG: V-type ATP synthase subunit I [Chlamydiae bacterium]|nr:V-type ATP synthase subunit I [Chlamydiota bacterium]
MIVDVEKYLIVGTQEHLEEFFARAQQEGFLEFSSLAGKKKSYSMPKAIQDLMTALKILKVEEVGVDPPYGKEFEVGELVERIIFLKNTLEKYHEEQRLLKQEIGRVAYFGEFSPEEVKEIEKESGRYVQFFFRSHQKSKEPLPSEWIIPIASDVHADYYVGIHEQPQYFQDFVELHFEHSLGELQKKLELVEYDLKAYHYELKCLKGYTDFLRKKLIEALNHHHLHIAKDQVEYYFEGKLFSLQAWIPVTDIKKLEPLLAKLAVHMEKVSIEKGEAKPTCMQNKGLRKVGEDLVKIYDIPSPQDRDPSGFVIGAFAIFFSMIVADAGYGLLYLVLSLIAFFKLRKKSPLLRRMTKLFILISSCCVVWGVLIASYFGLSLTPDNPFQRFSLTQELVLKKAAYHMEVKDKIYKEWAQEIPDLSSVKTPMDFVLSIKKEKNHRISYEILEDFSNSILMELALLVGMVHIIISLLRYFLRNFSSIGWITCIIGGYLFFPFAMDDATSIVNFLGIIPKQTGREVGAQLVYAGVAAAWILAVIQHKKGGIEEPLKSVQIFADILSYLRLYALSLAGMIMATTFNQMGKDVGYAIGFFIIVAGHLLNMTIGIMGGFIHGLRLNFLEWYHYSFEGGGKLFDPLRIIK